MSPDSVRLWQALDACKQHAQALTEALDDIAAMGITGLDLADLSRADRRLLDQFAYRYTRLQDDMGARLMPAALRALGEDVVPMALLDRLDRLEQLGWLPSAEEWSELRQIRNEFVHAYPETPAERLANLEAAITSASRMLAILKRMDERVTGRFGASG